MNKIFVKEKFKITFITPRLFRIETKNYTTENTQVVINRNSTDNFIVFEKKVKNNYVFISDEINVKVDYNGIVLKIYFKKSRKTVKEFHKGNLLGTARTLDWVDGPVKLSEGVISKNGVAILDDSKSLIIKNNKILSRKKCTDMYYFAYEDNYREAIKALYLITGNVPLIPRYALGNWWSRYHAYKDYEYLELMERFKANNIPISVAVIDMDWHYVDNYNEFKDDSIFTEEELSNEELMDNYYDGWTGYSFNKHLFKDYVSFLKTLQNDNYKVTLNLHPASGVRKYEVQFNDMAKALNLDPNTINTIPFDITSLDFVKAYMEVLHHPYENQGVDFWWIDWQQGFNSKMKDLDPLWALNHYHYLDNNRANSRPLILSRYSGPGSHRYPLGFSGDTHTTWKCLNFQPYFTANSANIGYSWWSHDIGGHMAGYKDNELYIRWLQLGVFSPINRLHSTCNEYTSKEPWRYIPYIENIANDYLRLRKKLIPYIYSMNYQTYKNGRALVEPMYYSYKEKEAYNVKNQFMFGSELMVAPITCKNDKVTTMGKVNVYFPKDTWFDIFTDQIYNINQLLIVNRTIEYIPVFAKKGSIIPMYVDGVTNNIDCNQDLEILVYSGNNEFELYEDDGATKDYLKGIYSIKKLIVNENNNNVTFKITKNINEKFDLTFNRNIYINFKNIVAATIKSNVEYENDSLNNIKIKVQDINEDIIIELSDCIYLKNKDISSAMIKVISSYQMNNDIKSKVFFDTPYNYNKLPDVNKKLLEPLIELITIKEE